MLAGVVPSHEVQNNFKKYPTKKYPIKKHRIKKKSTNVYANRGWSIWLRDPDSLDDPDDLERGASLRPSYTAGEKRKNMVSKMKCVFVGHYHGVAICKVGKLQC